MILQNLTGLSVAGLFDLPTPVGLLGGTVSLIGGHGTAIAWAPAIADDHGVINAMEIGIACATFGLILASLMGGPIAKYLITKYDLRPRHDTGATAVAALGTARGRIVGRSAIWIFSTPSLRSRQRHSRIAVECGRGGAWFEAAAVRHLSLCRNYPDEPDPAEIFPVSAVGPGPRAAPPWLSSPICRWGLSWPCR